MPKNMLYPFNHFSQFCKYAVPL